MIKHESNNNNSNLKNLFNNTYKFLFFTSLLTAVTQLGKAEANNITAVVNWTEYHPASHDLLPNPYGDSTISNLQIPAPRNINDCDAVQTRTLTTKEGHITKEELC